MYTEAKQGTLRHVTMSENEQICCSYCGKNKIQNKIISITAKNIKYAQIYLCVSPEYNLITNVDHRSNKKVDIFFLICNKEKRGSQNVLTFTLKNSFPFPRTASMYSMVR